MLVVVIGTVLVDVTTSVEAGCVWTEVTVRVVPGAVLRSEGRGQRSTFRS